MELNPPPPNTSLFQLNLDANNSYALRGAASWAKVLAILGIIFGLIFIAGGALVMNALNNTSRGFYDYEDRDTSRLIESLNTPTAVTFIVIGVITVIGSIFALNFGSRISTALRINDQNTLRSGFAGLRNYFAFWSVLMIIYLLLVIVLFAAGAMQNM